MSSPDFDKAFEVLMKVEGHRPVENDEGRGNARWGVTQMTLNNCWAKFPGVCTELELPIRAHDFEIEDAKKFYKRFFWDTLGLDQAGSHALAQVAFLAAVHLGERRVERLLEHRYKGLPYVVRGLLHTYDRLMKRPEKKKFIPGWTWRVLMSVGEAPSGVIEEVKSWRAQWLRYLKESRDSSQG